MQVTGQAGGGSHRVVPQDVNGVVEPVQPILHAGLQREGQVNTACRGGRSLTGVQLLQTDMMLKTWRMTPTDTAA